MTPVGLLHRTELTEANDKLLAVQECYISVCREKDELEERGRNRAEEENLIQEKEVANPKSTCLLMTNYANMN